jgi:hypothetical protein
MIRLSNVDDDSDFSEPISTAAQGASSLKVGTSRVCAGGPEADSSLAEGSVNFDLILHVFTLGVGPDRPGRGSIVGLPEHG